MQGKNMKKLANFLKLQSISILLLAICSQRWIILLYFLCTSYVINKTEPIILTFPWIQHSKQDLK